MGISIRRRIIDAVDVRLASIQIANGFNTDAGQNVTLNQPQSGSTLPCLDIQPGSEEVDADRGRAEFRIRIEGVIEAGNLQGVEESEKLLADIVEVMTAREIDIDFINGLLVGIDPVPGDYVETESGSFLGMIANIEISSGSFNGGNAAGTMTFRRCNGRLRSGDVLQYDGEDMLTVDSILAHRMPEDLAGGGLAENIAYAGGGPLVAEEPGGTLAGAFAEFRIAYRPESGNPYAVKQ